MEVAFLPCGSSYSCIDQQNNLLSLQLRGPHSLMATGLQGTTNSELLHAVGDLMSLAVLDHERISPAQGQLGSAHLPMP